MSAIGGEFGALFTFGFCPLMALSLVAMNLAWDHFNQWDHGDRDDERFDIAAWQADFDCRAALSNFSR